MQLRYRKHESDLSTREKLARFFPGFQWVFRKVWAMSPGWLSLKLLFSIVPSGLLAVQALIARELVNALVDEMGKNNGDFARVAQWIILGVVVTIVREMATGLQKYASRRLSEILQVQITLDVLEHSNRLEVQVFENPELQDILERAQQNIAGNFMMFINQIFTLVTNVIALISIVAILIVIDPIATFLLFPIAIPYVLFYWHQVNAQYQIERNRTTRRRWIRYYSGLLLSNISVREVKLLDLAKPLLQRYRKFMDGFIAEDRRIYTRQIIGDIIFEFLFAIALAGASGWIAWRVFRGALTLGDLVIYGRASSQLQSTIESSSTSITSILEQTLYVNDLIEFFKITPSLASKAGQVLEHVEGAIRLDNVFFNYPGSAKTVLNGVSLEIKPGEVVALVGENGSGKTTIASLIAHLYDPVSGVITLDGHDLRDLDLNFVYSQVGYVLQQFNQYEATVKENIAYGDWPNLLENQAGVEKIASAVGIHDMIQAMPEQYDTLLGRMFGSYTLSGGQWQKIAIARALARNASVIILDEPTAALDAQAEYDIFSRFREISQGKTTILISHRFSTVSIADRIIVLDNGSIVEQGSHDELLALNGHYAGLYQLHQTRLNGHG